MATAKRKTTAAKPFWQKDLPNPNRERTIGPRRNSDVGNEAANNSADKLLFFIAIMALVAIDQLAKAAVRHFLPASASIQVFGPVQLTHWANTGSVFGLFPGTSAYIAILSLAAVPIVVGLYLLGFLRQRVATTLLVAGLVGNTIDRLGTGFVTDFIYIKPWPAFNLADSFLTIGILLFAASAIRQHIFRKRKSGKNA